LHAIGQKFLPHTVLAPAPTGAVSTALAEIVPLLADRPARDGRATIYICENFACQQPVLGVDGVNAALNGSKKK
jgi:uncharacterized protein YyaL (SSP411 family)